MLDVIPHRYYRHTSGRVASIYGASPWVSDRERAEWEIVTDGYTVLDHDTNTIGAYNIAARDFASVKAFADRINAQRQSAREAHRKAWEPVNAPVNWNKLRGNDGILRHHSGENISIAKHGDWYVIEEAGDDTDMPAFRSLKKAKEWSERYIRNVRKDHAFA